MVLIQTQIKYQIGLSNMKNITITIALFSLMGFNAYQSRPTTLQQARENLDEMKSMILEDINSGRMDPELGEIYLDEIAETDSLVLEI